MITIQPAVKYRPVEFRDIEGQDELYPELIHSMMKQTLPQFSMFSGPTGSGKTSIALALSKALQCENYDTAGRVCCGDCRWCKKPVDYIDHYDCPSTDVNKRTLEMLARKTRMSPLFCKVNVTIFEEAHAWTEKDQRKLLVPLEKRCKPNQMTIFTTTDPKKLIKPLRTRLVEYRVRRLGLQPIIRILNRVKDEMGLELSGEDILALARLRGSDGRSAVNLLPRLETKRKLNPAARARDLIFQL